MEHTCYVEDIQKRRNASKFFRCVYIFELVGLYYLPNTRNKYQSLIFLKQLSKASSNLRIYKFILYLRYSIYQTTIGVTLI
jgi:hypothetical protein